MSLEPTATPFLQTRRFFANNHQDEEPEVPTEETAPQTVPVSEERDKVFTEKKMTMMDHIFQRI